MNLINRGFSTRDSRLEVECFSHLDHQYLRTSLLRVVRMVDGTDIVQWASVASCALKVPTPHVSRHLDVSKYNTFLHTPGRSRSSLWPTSAVHSTECKNEKCCSISAERDTVSSTHPRCFQLSTEPTKRLLHDSIF